jgi:oligoendopeptidase F
MVEARYLEMTIRPSRWDLNKFYQDKTGKVLIEILAHIKVSLNQIEVDNDTSLVSLKDLNVLSDLIKQIEKAESFYYCLTLEDTESSFLSFLNTSISALKSQTSDLTSGKNSSNITATYLAKETLRSFENDYIQLRNNIRIEVKGFEDENDMSFSKANNQSFEHPDPLVRNKIFIALNSSLSSQSDEFASVYNEIIGTRLNLYKINEEKDYLGESLRMNGLSCKTLETMYEVISTNSSYLAKFLEGRAKEANKEKLSWHELMTSTQEVANPIHFSKAVVGISNALGSIDKGISEFIKNTIIDGWVDSELRDSKAPGGFCVPFINEGESRRF